MTRSTADGFLREDLPPLEPVQYTPIYSPPAGHTFRLVALSPRPVGIYTHFYLNRTVACVGQDRGCICNQIILAKRWKGYIAAWDRDVCRICLAEITKDTLRAFKLFHGDPAMSIQGREFSLFRFGKKKNAPVRIALGGLFDGREQLPDPPDVIGCLRRIFQVPDIARG